MKVIQASLQRTEKNTIRQAVRSVKQERIEKNQRDKIKERIDFTKISNEERAANVLKRKQLMSAERERKRLESMQKEHEQMLPVRMKFNMTQGWHKDPQISPSSKLFKAGPSIQSDQSTLLPPQPPKGIGQKSKSIAGFSIETPAQKLRAGSRLNERSSTSVLMQRRDTEEHIKS